MILRPNYHFTPPQMWLNDPNGLVFFDGEYHLFYQYHPDSAIWGPMHWGHAVSRDLVNWQHLPIALYPDEHGMIYSGSAVVDWNNTAGFAKEALVAIFTYNKDYKESQNLAYSTNKGRTWTKYPGNPVIPAPVPPTDYRDPKVFWHQDHWVMVLAAGDKVLLFASADLKHWEQTGSFGGGYGSTESVWETPDLFRLPVQNSDESRWILTVSEGKGGPAGGSATQYFIGEFDGGSFQSENPKNTILWTDFGADYYAPQSWNDEPNGRRLMIGWMNNWSYARQIPASEWRGAFNLIRELSLKRTGDGICLVQRPILELQNLRGAHQHWSEQIIQPGKNILTDMRGSSLEMLAEFQVTEEIDAFGFRVRVGAREWTTIGYDPKEQKLFVDRTHSGIVDFHESFAGIHFARLDPLDHRIRLHIFVDNSSVEVFANDGLITFSECIFPAEESQGLELFATGGNVLLCSLDIFQLQPATFQSEGNSS